MQNLHEDLADSGVYTILMGHLAPEKCNQQSLRTIFDIPVQSCLDTLLEPEWLEEMAKRKQRAELVLANARLLGCTLPLDADDLARGHPRMHLLLLIQLLRGHIGIRAFPTEEDLVCMEEQMESLSMRCHETARELDEYRHRTDIQMAETKQLAIQEQYELRKQSLAKEFQLFNRLEDLERKWIAECDHHQQTHHEWEGYRSRVHSTMNRTLRLLRSYMERRRQIFSDASVYTISAFNNQGKRITFHIPAPALKSHCAFDFNDEDVDVDVDVNVHVDLDIDCLGGGLGHPETPPQSPTWSPSEAAAVPRPRNSTYAATVPVKSIRRRSRRPAPPPPEDQAPFRLTDEEIAIVTGATAAPSSTERSPPLEQSSSPPSPPAESSFPSHRSMARRIAVPTTGHDDDSDERPCRRRCRASGGDGGGGRRRVHSAPGDFNLDRQALTRSTLETLVTGVAENLKDVMGVGGGVVGVVGGSCVETLVVTAENIRSSMSVEKKPANVNDLGANRNSVRSLLRHGLEDEENDDDDDVEEHEQVDATAQSMLEDDMPAAKEAPPPPLSGLAAAPPRRPPRPATYHIPPEAVVNAGHRPLITPPASTNSKLAEGVDLGGALTTATTTTTTTSTSTTTINRGTVGAINPAASRHANGPVNVTLNGHANGTQNGHTYGHAANVTTVNGAWNDGSFDRETYPLAKDLHQMVRWLVEENLEQMQQIQLLAAKVDEMSWLNQVMGEKVKEFSEELINKGKGGRGGGGIGGGGIGGLGKKW